MASTTLFRQFRRLSACASVSGRLLQTIRMSSCKNVTPHVSYPARQKYQTRCYCNVSTPVINIQDFADFQARVVESEVPVIVDFHASWCGPCKLLGPRLETIVSRKDGKVILAKVDIDELGDIAIKYRVEAVPTVISFKNGQSGEKFVGLQDDDQIESFVEKLVN